MALRVRLVAAACVLATGLLAPLGTATAADPDVGMPGEHVPGWLEKKAADRYIVVMEKDPLVARFGQDRLGTTAADRAAGTLEGEQDEALEAVGKKARDKTTSYTVALNGFATALTQRQAEKMANLKSVKLVVPDALRQKTTDSSPKFLGLTGRGGVWAQGYTGEKVVVGVIDTGIWPEHPSFADDGSYPEPQATMDTSAGPTCDFGNEDANPLDKPFTCNNKLIGARQMLDTYRAVVGQAPDEYDSARDDDGHGTHTASTAAGNRGVHAEIFGIDRGSISGIAPRAQIIAYKGLGNGGGFTSDLVSAIDQAVEDGVDVINYSVGGGPTLTQPDDIAYLFAADAGVFVATSAGNSGPGAGTIGGPASVPWLTSVGASTQPRFFQGTVVLGNGRRITGASVTPGVSRHKLVDAANAGGELCVPGTLGRAVVEDAIVLCRRGQVGRAEKSLAVQQAGGVGMVLYDNSDTATLMSDSHVVASVHVVRSAGLAIKAYAERARRPVARIVGEQLSTLKSAPSMADFSSRGQDPVAEDLIKPDVTAPGVQILAGASPTPDPGNAQGELFQAIAGTSMSSPHVAGAFALIKQAHPDWSPAMAKSALMTTAYQRVRSTDQKSRATPFDMGAGHIDLAGQHEDGTPFEPGLVYDAGLTEYVGFLCDADRSVLDDATCDQLEGAGVPTQAQNLNLPSIGVAAVPGTETVQRTITNVSDRPGTHRFKADVDAPKGYTVDVSPARLSLRAGQSATFEVTITNKRAPVGEWRFGSLSWQGRGVDVYSPIAVKASMLDAPAAVEGSGDSGSVEVPVRFGYTGAYAAGAHGLVPATVTGGTVAQDPDQNFDPTDGFSDAVSIEVSDGTLLRVALPPDAVDDPEADLDLYLFDPSGNQVATSTNGGTDELIDVADPADGTWTLYVHGWQAPGGSTDYSLSDWVVPATPGGGSLSIDSAPASAQAGTTGTVTASWTGAAGAWNLGAVSHSNAGGVIDLTLLEVDNRP